MRQAVHAFQSGLLASSPAIPGLDPSIVIHPRRLHLTLGVMSLSSTTDPADSNTKTVQSALDLLRSLRPQIMRLLAGHTLRVPLNRMHIMNPRRGRLDDAHVLWMGPAHHDEGARRLRAVSGISFHCPCPSFLIDRTACMQTGSILLSRLLDISWRTGPFWFAWLP